LRREHAGFVCGAGFALVALAVPGFSTTFDFTFNAGGDYAAVGGTIILGPAIQTVVNGDTTTTVAPVTTLQGVPLSPAPAVPGIPGLTVWNDDTLAEQWEASYTDVFLLNMLTPTELTVTGGIASLGIAPGTLLWTIGLASPMEATASETVSQYGTLVSGQFSVPTIGTTIAMDYPALLNDIGIEPASGTQWPFTIGLNTLGSNMDNVYYGNTTYFWGMSDILDFNIDTETPEPGTLLPLGLGLAGMALWAGGKLTRRA